MKPLQPEHLKYQGFFRLPRQGNERHQKFSYGGDAMCYNPANDSLFIGGHRIYDLVAEVKVPGDDVVAEHHESAYFIRAFFDPAPDHLHEERKRLGLDSLGGIEIVEPWLYSSWFRYYGVQPSNEIDAPTLARVNADPDGMSPRLQHIGPEEPPFHQKATSGYMFKLPADWAEVNGIPDQILACGRGDGAGKATSPKGPTLFAVDPNNPEKATVLLYRGPQDSDPPGYTPCDQWHGGAWIRAGEYEAVVFVGEVAVEPWWYGQPDMPDEKPEWYLQRPVQGQVRDWRDEWREQGIRDRWNHAKGYHTTKREVRLQAYRTDSLGNAARNPTGRTHLALEPEWQKTLDVFHEASNPRACAYDPDGRRFFVFESYPPGKEGNTYPEEDPRVHVWRVEVPAAPTQPPERESISVRILIDGEAYAGDIEREDE